MIDQMIKDITTRFDTQRKNGTLRIMMAYTYNKSKCEEFMTEVNAALSQYGVQVSCMDPLSLSVSCHIGEGSLALCCAEHIKD